MVRAQLGDLQRARILSAMFDVACERGSGGVSVAHVVERAGVSRRTFYELFADREDCLLAAFEQALASVSERVVAAYEAQKGWRERIRAGLVALLSFLDEEPVIGRFLVAESLGCGVVTVARREAIATLTRAVEQGREQAKASLTIPPLTGEGLVGGAFSVIHSRLIEPNGQPLVGLVNSLMSMIVLPYLGSNAAGRELKRPTPTVSTGRRGDPLLGDPFKGTGMRLTYRTVRVLMAIADRPGASNRLVADTAEIKDQGQVSKLLGRLERAGMVANDELGPGHGAPNAWRLTVNGRQVTDSIRAHTEDRKSRDGQ